jgi:hypothetical protein
MEAAKKKNLPVLQSCGNYSAYAQMDNGSLNNCFWPQLSALDEIHQEAPNATFVFLFRDVDSWIRSFTNFRGGRLLRAFKRCRSKVPYNEGTKPEQLKQFVCNSVNHARNFVAAHPSHQLLEIVLDDPETGNIVSKVFGIDAGCWGAHNINAELRNTMTQDA